MKNININELLNRGFVAWNILVEDPNSFILEYPSEDNLFDSKNKCWKPSYRITVNYVEDKWNCIGWYSDETNKKNKIFKRVTAENIETIDDIQNVLNILHIDRVL